VTINLKAAGLPAHKIDGEHKLIADGGQACGNCHTPINGAFCHSCGQSAHIHHSLLDLFEEALHRIWHFDAKGWRTIPVLLFNPGKLTRLYIEGQRIRYVSPLTLFLFMIFFMFVVFSMTGVDANLYKDPTSRAKERVTLLKELEQAKTEVATAETVLKKHDANVDKIDLNATIIKFKIAEKALNKFDAESQGKNVADEPTSASSQDGKSNDKKINTGYAPLDLAIRDAFNNPDLALYKIKNTTYKFAFILLPISLPFLWLMFAWRRSIPIYDHAIFSLYSMSFMSILFSLLAVLAHFDCTGLAIALFLLVPPVHMFFQLRGTYQLSNGSALWRTVALLGVSSSAFIIFLIIVISMGLK
jgi:hypothetical protein